MPLVHLTTRELELGHLPPVCVYCGARATTKRSIAVQKDTQPQPRRYDFPACIHHDHEPTWVRYSMPALGGMIAIAAWVIFFAIMLDWGNWWIILSVGQLALSVFFFMYLCCVLPILINQTETILRLAFAHRGFSETVEDWRDWYQDHPEASFANLGEEFESGISATDEP
jgi:hypothetical protein